MNYKGPNPSTFNPDGTVSIELTQGQTCVVDAADYPKVQPYRWQADLASHGGYYVVGDVENKRIRMHIHLVRPQRGQLVDHRDGDGLNNRRSNIRIATRLQNVQNQRPNRGGYSRFKGVCWNKNRRKWCAYISVEGKRQHLGVFVDEESAAKDYDAAAVKHFGEFANLNFPRRQAEQGGVYVG